MEIAEGVGKPGGQKLCQLAALLIGKTGFPAVRPRIFERQFWCSAEKKGYSGTAIFSKPEPRSVRYGIGIPELDTLTFHEIRRMAKHTPVCSKFAIFVTNSVTI